MTSHELIQLIDRFVDSFKEENLIVGRLKAFSTACDQVTPKFLALTTMSDSNKALQSCRDIAKDIVDAVGKIKSSMQSSTFFDELRELIESAESFALELPQQVPAISIHLTNLKNAYDAYIDRQKPDTATTVLFEGQQSYVAIKALRETLAAIRMSLIPNFIRSEHEDTLSLVFEENTDLEILASRLRSLYEAYRQLCELTGTSYSDFPLRIVKVETGSTYIEVIGAILPLSILRKSIARAAKIIFQRYVPEGRIDAEAEVCEHIRNTLDLRNELKGSGINTDGMDGILAEAGQAHAKSLFSLIGAGRSLKMDGVSIPPPNQSKLLASAKPLRRITTDLPTPGEPPDDECIDTGIGDSRQ